MSEKSKVMELKRLTLEKDADFSVLANYFFDMAENPEFLKKGKPYRKDQPFFKWLLKPVTQHFGETIEVRDLRLIRLEKLGFVHGSAILSNGILASLYFFEDQRVGLAIAYFNGQMELFRISAKEVPSHQIPVHLMTSTMQ